MGGSTLSIAIEAKITDLQLKLGLAKAEINSLVPVARNAAKEMNAFVKAGNDIKSDEGVKLATAYKNVTGALAVAGKEATGFNRELRSIGGTAAGVVGGIQAVEHSAGSAREAFVMLHEGMQGRFSRMPGSLMILVQSFGSIGPAALGSLVGVGALGFALYEFIEHAHRAEAAIQGLETTYATLGQVPAGGDAEIRARVETLATKFDLSTVSAAKYADAIQGSTRVASQSFRDAMGDILISIGQLQNIDAEKMPDFLKSNLKKTQTFAGLKEFSDEYGYNLDAALDAIAAKNGDATEKLRAGMELLRNAVNERLGKAVPAMQGYDQAHSWSNFFEAVGESGLEGGFGPTPATDRLMANFKRPDITKLATPSAAADREDPMKTLEGNIKAADDELKKFTNDYTLSAAQRAEAEARVKASIAIPGGTENTPDALKLRADQAEAQHKAQLARLEELTAARGAHDQALGASGTASPEAVTAARIASLRLELAAARGLTDTETRLRQQLAVETATLSNESAEKQIADLKRVAEADKSGTDRKLADLKAVADATIRLHRPEGEQADAQERVRQAQTEMLGGWQAAYDAGIKSRLSAAKGDAAQQSAILAAWADEARTLYGENSAEFAKTEEAKTRLQQEQAQKRVADLRKTMAEIGKAEGADLHIAHTGQSHVFGETPEQAAAEAAAIVDQAAHIRDAVLANQRAEAAGNAELQNEISEMQDAAAQERADKLAEIDAQMQAQIRADWQKTNHQISSGLADAVMDGLDHKRGGIGRGLRAMLGDQLKGAMSSGFDALLTTGEGALGLDAKSPGGLLGSGLDAIGLGGVGKFLGLAAPARGALQGPMPDGSTLDMAGTNAPQIAATTANTSALQALTAKLNLAGAAGAPVMGAQQGPMPNGGTVDAATQENSNRLMEVGSAVSNLTAVTGKHSAITELLHDVTVLNTLAILPNTVATILNTAAEVINDIKFWAGGGRPEPGKVAVIGEKGPELWVPDSHGTIIPNHRMSGWAADNFAMEPPAYATAPGGGYAAAPASGYGSTSSSTRGGDVNATINQTNHFSAGPADLHRLLADHVRTAGKSATRALIQRALNR